MQQCHLIDESMYCERRLIKDVRVNYRETLRKNSTYRVTAQNIIRNYLNKKNVKVYLLSFYSKGKNK